MHASLYGNECVCLSSYPRSDQVRDLGAPRRTAIMNLHLRVEYPYQTTTRSFLLATLAVVITPRHTKLTPHQLYRRIQCVKLKLLTTLTQTP